LSNKTGFDLAPGILSFGQITPNGSASRSITIDNLQNQKVKIEIKVKGEISNNIIASESNFYLQPNESKTITFTVFPDGLTTFKKYTGEVIIFTRKY